MGKFKKGDRVKINDDSYYDGYRGTVIRDQIDEDFTVDIRLDTGKKVYRQSYNIMFEGRSTYRYKNDEDKPRLDLVPPGIIEAVGTIRTYGVGKYGENTNWEKVEPERYRAALMRHLCKYLRNPSGLDEESGLPHLWHIACNIAFLCELEKKEHNK